MYSRSASSDSSQTKPATRRAQSDSETSALKIGAIFSATLHRLGASVAVLFGLLSLLALARVHHAGAGRDAGSPDATVDFFIITPLQYYLIGIAWYGFFAIMIPVSRLCSCRRESPCPATRSIFLERAAKIQFRLEMICAFCLSHAPALLFSTFPVRGPQRAVAASTLFWWTR